MYDFNNMAPWGQLARCVLNPDGTVAYFLDKDNSNLKSTGETVDWTEVESSGQNVMVQVPKFYYCKKKANGKFSFGVSALPKEMPSIRLDEWKIHPAFYRERGKLTDDQSGVATEVDYRYMSAFKGWVDGQGRLRSLPNKTPTVQKTIGAFRNHAKNMGNGWGQLDYYLLYALQILYITEFGHPDSQTTIGKGFTMGNSASATTGSTLQYGNNTFGEDIGKTQMSYRGIEDFWGNVLDWVDGLVTDGSYNILIGNKGFNDSGTGYTNIGKGASSNLSGYIKDIQDYEDAGFIMKTGGGSDSSGLYDYGALNSGRVAYFGGYWSDGLDAGAFYLPLIDAASSSYRIIGSRGVF